MLNNKKENITPSKIVLIFLSLSFLFCFSMFYRAFMAVISSDLMGDLHINAEKLGILGAAFFYCFAILQIPLGPMLDRIAPGIVIGFFSLTGGLGVLLFSISESFTLSLIGRVLMGAGAACALMGAFKVFTIIFPKDRFATVSGLFIAVGTIGSLLATSPFAYLSATIGWRTTLVLFGLMTIALACSVFWILRSIKPGEKTNRSTDGCQQKINIFHAGKLILGSLPFWQISALAFCQYGTFIALQGLWLGVYLIDIGGYSSIQAGHMLSVLALGHALGSPCAGWLSDKIFCSKKRATLCGLSLYCLSMIPLLGLFKIHSVAWYIMIYFSLSFFRAFGVLIHGHVKELYPTDLAGTAMAWTNFFVAAGSAFFMQLMGKVIELFPHTGQAYSLTAYRTSFLICFISMAVSLIWYAFSKEETALSKD
jgi:MFS family permease